MGKDQVAEAKSRSAKGVEDKRDQCRRIRDIQQKLFNPAMNPRAKLDGSKSDVGESTAIYLRRGFDVEVV